MPKNQTKKPDGKHYRGLSRNKIRVVTATDGINVFLAVCGRGKPSRARILKSFDLSKGKDYVLIYLGDAEATQIKAATVADYRPDDTSNFLYVWENTYNAATASWSSRQRLARM